LVVSAGGVPAILVLSEQGAALAQRLAEVLPGAAIHARKDRVAVGDRVFTETTAEIAALFRQGRPIVALMAAGIVVRALSPHLVDKTKEPPVVVVAEDGSAVIPLLGGHRGANGLARQIAEALGVRPAISTAGDLAFGVALDDPPDGYTLANPEDVKAVTARLLAGEALRIEGEAPWLDDAELPRDEAAELCIRVTTVAVEGDAATLVYHPRCLALGVGCERDAEPEELWGLTLQTLSEAGVSPRAVGGVFSIDLKSDEAAVLDLAERLGRPARFFPAARLEAERERLTQPSDLVFREVGCHGVSEGAALAAAGPTGKLVVAKRKSRRATLAIAQAPAPLEAVTIGRGRGSLAIVGIGPGAAVSRTAEAEAAIAAATDLVGYKLYLDLLGPLAPDQRRHDHDLGEEEARVRLALDLAAEGREVALVSSGDPGVYAMAALVFELLEREHRADWMRIALRVVPGVSAMQVAAARSGAPLGHDFCAISLSDLLTPWAVIEKRIAAAAAGDFVVAFYNPVSRRRRHQLVRALEILRHERPEEVPVVVARSLGREGEAITVTTLAGIDPADVDMLSLVLVGSSTTRTLSAGSGNPKVYTPRGYANKHAPGREEAG
jgi:cobalt-precorrin 5A hydrolase/precorrin-3B C17-methyltransferase